MKKLIVILMCIVCMFISACDTTEEILLPQELDTPQYTVDAPPDISFEEIEDDDIHSAEDDVKIIGNKDSVDSEENTTATDNSAPAENVVPFDVDTVWEEDETVTYNSYTLPEKVELEDGSLGTLSIPEIALTVSTFEAEDGEDMLTVMDTGAAHFKTTSSWDGNIGLSAHNAVETGSADFFKDLHTLEKDDIIYYSTALGEREYKISNIKVIEANDWSYLNRTDDNRITLITCVTGQIDKRLMIQAMQK